MQQIRHDVVEFGPVCNVHYKRICHADKRNRAIKKLTSKKRAKACWMNPVEVASHDDDNMDELNILTEGNETICIRYHDSRIATQKDVTYTRRSPDSPWTFVKSMAADVTLPMSVRIVPEDYVPLRHAKTRTRFREHLLKQVHECHKVLGNLVLFKCVICKNRIVTFHPDHQPSEPLAMMKTYPNAVAEWQTSPTSERTKQAAFHKGKCQRCLDQLAKVEKDASLQGIATFRGRKHDGPFVGVAGRGQALNTR